MPRGKFIPKPHGLPHNQSIIANIHTYPITVFQEKISMVSAALLNFVSQLFANIHNNDIAFGGINIIVAGDLAQLPPVGGTQVSFWKKIHGSLDSDNDEGFKKFEEMYKELKEATEERKNVLCTSKNFAILCCIWDCIQSSFFQI